MHRFTLPTVLTALALAVATRAHAQVSTPPIRATPPAPGPQSGPAAARQAPTSADSAASPMGRAAQELLRALNAPDDSAVRSFVATYASSELTDRLTAPQYVSALVKLREQAGGLELIRVLPAPGSNARLFLKPRKVERLLGIELIPDPHRPDRFQTIGFHPMSDPSKEMAAWEVRDPLDDAALAALVERNAERAAGDGRFSGVVLVARGDHVLLHRAYGMADRQRGVPNTTSTRFHIGSMDKMFTAVSVAQLVEAGKLSFDDTLARVLPGYPNRDAASRITLRQLLTHTAGVGDPFESPAYDPARPPRGPQSAWFPLFAGAPLRFEPGQRHEYSNGGFLVLGAVIERVTGRPYHEYVRDHVFRRARMTDTEPARDGTIPHAAQGYYRKLMDDPLAIGPEIPNTEFAGKPAVGVAMGGSYLTALDVFRFARALRGHRLLSPALTDTVVTGKVPVVPGSPARYGFGFYDADIGTHVRGHSGGGEGSGIDSDLEMVWDPDYTVVVLGNLDTPAARSLAQGIARAIVHRGP